jgi:hypothetical protein
MKKLSPTQEEAILRIGSAILVRGSPIRVGYRHAYKSEDSAAYSLLDGVVHSTMCALLRREIIHTEEGRAPQSYMPFRVYASFTEAGWEAFRPLAATYVKQYREYAELQRGIDSTQKIFEVKVLYVAEAKIDVIATTSKEAMDKVWEGHRSEPRSGELRAIKTLPPDQGWTAKESTRKASSQFLPRTATHIGILRFCFPTNRLDERISEIKKGVALELVWRDRTTPSIEDILGEESC